MRNYHTITKEVSEMLDTLDIDESIREAAKHFMRIKLDAARFSGRVDLFRNMRQGYTNYQRSVFLKKCILIDYPEDVHDDIRGLRILKLV